MMTDFNKTKSYIFSYSVLIKWNNFQKTIEIINLDFIP